MAKAPGLRLGGAILIVCGLMLGMIGAYLLSVALHLPLSESWPDILRITPPTVTPPLAGRVLSGAGLASLFLIVLGSVTFALGGSLLVLGRRSRRLAWLFFGLVAVFWVAGVVATLQAGHRIGQIGM